MTEREREIEKERGKNKINNSYWRGRRKKIERQSERER